MGTHWWELWLGFMRGEVRQVHFMWLTFYQICSGQPAARAHESQLQSQFLHFARRPLVLHPSSLPVFPEGAFGECYSKYAFIYSRCGQGCTHTVARPDAPRHPSAASHASCLHNFLLQIILLGQLLHPLLAGELGVVWMRGGWHVCN